jgi:hypothetical protein
MVSGLRSTEIPAGEVILLSGLPSPLHSPRELRGKFNRAAGVVFLFNVNMSGISLSFHKKNQPYTIYPNSF